MPEALLAVLDKWDFSGPVLHSLAWATWNTLLLTLLAMPLAVIADTALALARMSPLRLLRWPARVYIEVIRGTPLLVQLFLVYHTLPQLGASIDGLFGWNEVIRPWLLWDNFGVGVFCLAANYAAYEAEIIRAGIQAVDKGQREAALSIGMSERQAFGLVVMPQAFRIVVPPIINDAIAMLKDSCLVSIIGMTELLKQATNIGKAKVNLPEMLVTAAAIYLVLSLALAWLGAMAERWLSLDGKRDGDERGSSGGSVPPPGRPTAALQPHGH